MTTKVPKVLSQRCCWRVVTSYNYTQLLSSLMSRRQYHHHHHHHDSDDERSNKNNKIIRWSKHSLAQLGETSLQILDDDDRHCQSYNSFSKEKYRFSKLTALTLVKDITLRLQLQQNYVNKISQIVNINDCDSRNSSNSNNNKSNNNNRQKKKLNDITEHVNQKKLVPWWKELDQLI